MKKLYEIVFRSYSLGSERWTFIGIILQTISQPAHVRVTTYPNKYAISVYLLFQ